MKWVAVTCIVILACSPKIKEGRVIRKAHDEARTYHTILMIPIFHSTGKASYTTLIPVPYTIHHPEGWCVTIADSVNGKYVRRKLWTDADTFNSVQVGCWYTKRGCDNDAAPQDRKVRD